MPNFEVKVLVNLVQGLGVDPLGDVGVFFGPILEDEFEVGADAHGFFEEFIDVFVEEKLEGVGD